MLKRAYLATALFGLILLGACDSRDSAPFEGMDVMSVEAPPARGLQPIVKTVDVRRSVVTDHGRGTGDLTVRGMIERLPEQHVVGLLKSEILSVIDDRGNEIAVPREPYSVSWEPPLAFTHAERDRPGYQLSLVATTTLARTPARIDRIELLSRVAIATEIKEFAVPITETAQWSEDGSGVQARVASVQASRGDREYRIEYAVINEDGMRWNRRATPVVLEAVAVGASGLPIARANPAKIEGANATRSTITLRVPYNDESSSGFTLLVRYVASAVVEDLPVTVRNVTVVDAP